MKKESTMIILSDDIIFRKAVIHLLNVELGKFAPAQDLFMMQRRYGQIPLRSRRRTMIRKK